jgi:endonuclease/exonuclease/phosphatase (EEP) superfamily protein YafD
MEKRKPHGFRRAIAAPVILYAVLIVGWAIAHRLVGDGFWLLALANALAVYLFVPLPLMALLALLARRRAAWAALLVVALLFVGLFDGELTPPLRMAHAGDGAPALTVMTYNVFYTTTDAAPIAASIAQAEPDVIAFQELSHLRAQALAQMIGEIYPHRTPIDPDQCYVQAAIWSRYPILKVEDVDPDVLCRMRSVVIDFNTQPVRVVNVHAWPYTGTDRESIEQGFRWREEQIDLVLDMVEGQPEPLVLLGDLNSAPMSELYQTLSTHYGDAFTEAGWGLGHTWPAEGGHWWSIPYPHRFVRIDYVFHSAEWRAEDAWVAEWDGISDHHAVVAKLRLLPGD